LISALPREQWAALAVLLAAPAQPPAGAGEDRPE
jgi:hypothetical protein